MVVVVERMRRMVVVRIWVRDRMGRWELDFVLVWGGLGCRCSDAIFVFSVINRCLLTLGMQ